MKRRGLLYLVFSILFTIPAVEALPAQTLGHQIKVEVPFRFMVNEQALPAGAYTVTRVGDQGVLLIRGEDEAASALMLTSFVSLLEPRKDTKLLFDRYGDHYFLSQVWETGAATGQRVVKSPAERQFEMTRMAARPEPAHMAGMAGAAADGKEQHEE